MELKSVLASRGLTVPVFGELKLDDHFLCNG